VPKKDSSFQTLFYVRQIGRCYYMRFNGLELCFFLAIPNKGGGKGERVVDLVVYLFNSFSMCICIFDFSNFLTIVVDYMHWK
jgi:hypothetical protein